MKAKVTKEFDALPPGARKNKTYQVGDILDEEVDGHVVQLAIDNNCATATGNPAQRQQTAPVPRQGGQGQGGNRQPQRGQQGGEGQGEGQ